MKNTIKIKFKNIIISPTSKFSKIIIFDKMFEKDGERGDEPEDESSVDGERDNYSIKQWILHYKNTYGISVCLLLTFVYFNMGFRALLSLTVKDLFKHYLELEPTEAQFFSAAIYFPWGLKGGTSLGGFTFIL
jgi:hypothetical protein